MYHDGIQLANDREKFEPTEYAEKTTVINRRLDDLDYAENEDPDASQLAKRLAIHADSMFTFLDYPDVPPDNNAAVREIRNAVIARKTSFHNMSALGADTQSKWMNIIQTLKKRVANPITVVYEALAEFISTGRRPPLPCAADRNHEP